MKLDVKKIALVSVVALALFLLITRPAESAVWVQSAMGGLRDAAEAIVTFIQRVFSG